MINYIRTGEQTLSNHGRETVINQAKEMVRTPGFGVSLRVTVLPPVLRVHSASPQRLTAVEALLIGATFATANGPWHSRLPWANG